MGNPEISRVTHNDLVGYFAYLRTEYIPKRSDGNQAPLSGSTLQNHWKAIRTFFRWAAEELGVTRPDERLKLPPNNPRVIMPLAEEDVKALLRAAERTRPAKTTNRNSFTMKRSTAKRDIALIILLLDTGIRAGECCRLDIGDVYLDAGEITIVPFGSSRRKTKSRILPIGKATRRVLWRYLTERNEPSADEPLFISGHGRRLKNYTIRHLLVDLGNKAGVKNCHPHRLRHSFAVSYLRNGGDVFTLQALLGHTTLDMVKTYVQLAQVDVKNVHRRASPADNWKL
jgi:integrase/recombinase XerD